jgi:hypothetical protein
MVMTRIIVPALDRYALVKRKVLAKSICCDSGNNTCNRPAFEVLTCYMCSKRHDILT